MQAMGAWVGRDAEVAKLARTLADARDGTGAFVLLSGEPGIGKSRLADEAASAARALGFVVAWGRAWEAEGTPAYWPWSEVTERLAASPEVEGVLARARKESPELDALTGSGAARDAAMPAQARFRLGAAMGRLLTSASRIAPLLLVLEDLHVADAASLELAAFVARDLRGARVVAIGTTRDASFVGSPETVALLSRIARDATHVPLRALTRDAVLSWVEREAPRLAPEASRIFEMSAGNPLFVRELLEGWDGTADVRTLPLGLRGVIRAHLERASAATRQTLARATVLGREVDVDIVQALAGADAAALGAAVDEALACGLVTRAGDRLLRFVHVLVRDELYAELPPALRSELHRTAARHFAGAEANAATTAHHALLGADEASASFALCAALAATTAATRRFAYADAAALGERALRTLGAWLSPSETGELLVAIGEAQIQDGRREVGQQTCLLAASRADEADDPVLLARGALAHALEDAFGRGTDHVPLLRRARARLGDADPALRARLVARLATASYPPVPGMEEDPLALVREAIELTRSLTDDDARLGVYGMLATTFPETFSAHDRFALNAETIALAEKLGRVGRVVLLFGWQVACWLELGRLDGAKHELAHAEKRFELLPSSHGWRLKLMRSLLATCEGRFDEADALIREAFDDEEGRLLATVAMMAQPYVRGEPMDHVGAEVRRIQGAIPGSKLFLSLEDAVAGRFDRVREAMELTRTLDLRGVPGSDTLGWPVVLAKLTEHAPRFYEIASERVERSPLMFAPAAVASMGPRALLAGRLALLAGDLDAAEMQLARSLDLATRLGAPPFVAQTELALAEVAAARSGDARGHAARAREIAGALGMNRVAEQARALAGAPCAVSRATTAPSSSPTVAITRRGEMWSLTVAGREVLLKDARGLAYLEVLLLAPHRPVHVLELLGEPAVGGDAGPLLDDRAKRAYRARAAELRDELDEATRFADIARAEKARAELEALGDELARAVGLGGKDRVAGSAAERARINVQRRLRDVVKRVSEVDPALGEHLSLSLKTGTFCMYAPTWPATER